jgi:hypothetical protein
MCSGGNRALMKSNTDVTPSATNRIYLEPTPKQLLLITITDTLCYRAEGSMANNNDFHSRLSRLETLIDNIIGGLNKIEARLSESTKINWAPIAIGVTVFFTVCGSVATIYNTRIATLNSAVEALANRTLDLEKGDVQHTTKIQTLENRVDQIQKDIDDLKDEHPRR